MKVSIKNIVVPESNGTKMVEAAELWHVRWYGRKNAYRDGLFSCVEAFLSREEAENFATSLRNAFELLRITAGYTDSDSTMVTVSNKS